MAPQTSTRNPDKNEGNHGLTGSPRSTMAHREWIGIINGKNAGLRQNRQTGYRATREKNPKKKNNRSSSDLFC
jgi:hypothetical protein